MHSDVLNCDNKAALPTPGAPTNRIVWESTGPLLANVSGACCMGLVGAKLLLLERRRRNESPRFITPARKEKSSVMRKLGTLWQAGLGGRNKTCFYYNVIRND